MPLAYSSSACSAAHPRLGSSARLHPSTQARQTTDASHERSSHRIRCRTKMFPKHLMRLLGDDCMCACLATESIEQSHNLLTIGKLYPSFSQLCQVKKGS